MISKQELSELNTFMKELRYFYGVKWNFAITPAKPTLGCVMNHCIIHLNIPITFRIYQWDKNKCFINLYIYGTHINSIHLNNKNKSSYMDNANEVMGKLVKMLYDDVIKESHNV